MSIVEKSVSPAPRPGPLELAAKTHRYQKKHSDLRFGAAIRAFCELIPAFEFELLDKGMRKQWDRAMEAHAKRFGMEPEQLAEGIGRIEKEDAAWEIKNVWKRGPYSDSLGELAAAMCAIPNYNKHKTVMAL